MNSEPDEFANAFKELWLTRTLPSDCPDISSLSIDAAYTVQQSVISHRVAMGERVVGYKIGCTSKAIRQQFGLAEPIFGRLMAPHVYDGETTLYWSNFVQCAVEPEFVLCIKHDLREPIVDEHDLRNAIEWVGPGIEVHNYKFWFDPPSSQELVASNGIHAALVVGKQRISATAFDFNLEGAGIFRNDALAVSGIGAEIMGGPLQSLQWLVKSLIQRNEYLRTGDLVIPGSPVGLVPVERNDRITAAFTHLGRVTADFS